jgi:hypothetical protein
MINALPPEPGIAPIKQGYVRLYHQTTEANLRSIEKNGLTIEHAKGIEGPRAVYAGEEPFYGGMNGIHSRPTLEFQVPLDKWRDPFVLIDVMPENFIAAHYPWHFHARTILDDERTLVKCLEGKFDHLEGSYAPAVQFIKSLRGKSRTAGTRLRFTAGTQTFVHDQATILYSIDTFDQSVDLMSLRVPRGERKAGEGRRAMEAFLAEVVDPEHRLCKLTACPLDSKTHLGKLVEFYKTFGFTVLCVNGAGYPRMVRKPR